MVSGHASPNRPRCRAREDADGESTRRGTRRRGGNAARSAAGGWELSPTRGVRVRLRQSVSVRLRNGSSPTGGEAAGAKARGWQGGGQRQRKRTRTDLDGHVPERMGTPGRRSAAGKERQAGCPNDDQQQRRGAHGGRARCPAEIASVALLALFSAGLSETGRLTSHCGSGGNNSNTIDAEMLFSNSKQKELAQQRVPTHSPDYPGPSRAFGQLSASHASGVNCGLWE